MIRATRLFTLAALAAFSAPLFAAFAGTVTNGSIPLDNLKGRYLNFEVGPVQPLAFAADGSALYALNQPGARLAVLHPVTLARTSEVPLGLGAASLVPRPGTDEVWVVDRVSSCVSVVDLSMGAITRTVRVGAEPHALAFTESGDRAYVTCSAVDRVDVIRTADYQVVNSIAIPAKNPRGVVVWGARAYVVSFLSGNNTAPLGNPGDPSSVEHVAEVTGPGVNPLPDRDLFVIPVQSAPELDALDLNATVTGLGTILFNLHRRPGTSELWIPNTEALNAAHVGEVNFVEGQVVKNRITIVDANGVQAPRIIDLDALAPPDARCGQPTGIAFHNEFSPTTALVLKPKSRAYVCGFGSDSVAVLDINGQGNVTWRGSIKIPPRQTYPQGVGPRTCVVDSKGRFLYVYNKRDISVTKVDLRALPTTPNFVYTAPFPVKLGFSPMATRERHGRHFFQSTELSKSNTTSCASCHVDGHTDGLVWDLSHYLDAEGTPDGALALGNDVKGPLYTQSVRRLEETGPYHWRGERRTISEFNATFINLMEHEENGEPANIGGNVAYMEQFMNRMPYAANPRQSIDRLYTQAELDGADLFMNKPVLGSLSCASCHVLPLGTAGDLVGDVAGGVIQSAVVPQLRGVGDKLSPAHFVGGDFGMRTELGAGLTHAGAFASLVDLALQDVPGQPGVQKFDLTPQEAGLIAGFLSALDTGMAPATAYQATAWSGNSATFLAQELAFLVGQAEAGNCDLVFYRTPSAPGFPFVDTGMYNVATNKFQIASASAAELEAQELMDEAANGQPVTFLGVPLGMGRTQGLDREMDGLFNLDEVAFGTNPEFSHSDGDLFPDGYEVSLGMDPLSTTASAPDTTPPALLGPVRVIYTTTNTIKIEFDTTEPCTVVSYPNGGAGQRIPVGNYKDDLHFLIINDLEPDSDCFLTLDMTDNAGNNFVDTSVVLHTRARVAADPVHVDDVVLAVTPGMGGAATLTADVTMLAGTTPAVDGYVVDADVFHIPIMGLPQVIQSGAQATTAGGVASFSVNVPALANPGVLHFVTKRVAAPVGAVPYVLALNVVSSASIAH